MSYFILFYEVVDDYLERRKVYRADHLALARTATERGELRYAGAYADPVDGAALVFRGQDATTAQAFAESDPYVTNGVVKNWYVREWSVVVGADYEGPVPST
ncbi:MAG: YciI-like protein [Acidimicrobiia bacterium]